MRHHFLTLALFLSTGLVSAQTGSVGIGTASPDASAKLEINATNQGLLPPRMTAAQRVLIVNPATGLVVYQTDGNPGLYFYNGVNWASADGTQVSNTGYPYNYGLVTTYAGITGNSSNTDGPVSVATFNAPYDVAFDRSTGNVYVLDAAASNVRKITPAGIVSTFAGSLTLVSGSTNDTGTAATFGNPNGIAADASGNLYIADQNNHKIRKITPTGVVSDFAGSGTAGFLDTSVAAAAKFNLPLGIAVDGSGNVYVADRNNQRIRKITPAGVVSTLAGNGTIGSTDASVGTAASFRFPTALDVDPAGNLYVADRSNHKIRKITPAGAVSTLAGSGTAASVDGTGSAASFNLPTGITVDGAGNVYVAEQGGNRVRRITPGGTATTLAGSGTGADKDGVGTNASFYGLSGIAIDPAGNLYVADQSNNKIRKVLSR